MELRKSRLVVLFSSMFATLMFALPVSAVPVSVTHSNSPTCDPLFVPPDVHELGHGAGQVVPGPGPFPPGEEIVTGIGVGFGNVICGSGDPNVVGMTNTSGIDWIEVWYVSDPETGFVNADGLVNGEKAFRIDNVISDPGGFHHPLLGESIAFNGIFEAGETWSFQIDGYSNTAGLPPDAFASLGLVGGLSGGDVASSGSIIAVPVPEPSTAALLALGLAGIAAGGKRKRG